MSSGRFRIAFALLVAAAFALLVTPTAGAADSDASTRVAPGVYMTEASAVDDGAVSEADSKPEPRIVGGHPIDISQAPWQAGLALNGEIYAGSGLDRQFCGGSVIAQNLILSAAHCMFDPRTNGPWADGELSVITGRTQLSSSQGQEIPVSRFFLFTDSQGVPLYNGQSSAWDLALVELGQPTSSPPIKIAGAGERELWAEGRRTEATGWGVTQFEGEKSDVLLAAELAIFPDVNCERAMGTGFDPETSICAGNFTGARDSCQGDSGGPLVAPTLGAARTLQGQYRLVGNVQSGVECARPQNPAAYGRLGAEPVMTPLRNGALQISGVDVYGSGAQPPTNLTRDQALELALLHAERACFGDRACKQFNARQCRPRSGGFRCLGEIFLKNRRFGKFRCFRKFLWIATSGRIEREPAGPGKCKPGW